MRTNPLTADHADAVSRWRTWRGDGEHLHACVTAGHSFRKDGVLAVTNGGLAYAREGLGNSVDVYVPHDAVTSVRVVGAGVRVDVRGEEPRWFGCRTPEAARWVVAALRERRAAAMSSHVDEEKR